MTEQQFKKMQAAYSDAQKLKRKAHALGVLIEHKNGAVARMEAGTEFVEIEFSPDEIVAMRDQLIRQYDELILALFDAPKFEWTPVDTFKQNEY